MPFIPLRNKYTITQVVYSSACIISGGTHCHLVLLVMLSLITWLQLASTLHYKGTFLHLQLIKNF